MERIKEIGLLYLLVFAVFMGCKTVKVLPNKSPVKEVSIKSLTKKITAQYSRINKLRVRIKTKYDDGRRSQNLVIQLRMQKDKAIWISASMLLIPLAKILITPERVDFYERFQKTYFQGGFEFINKKFNMQVTFKDIENLLLGRPLMDLSKEKLKQISNPDHYVLVPQSENNTFQPIFFFDPQTFLLKEQRILIAGTSQSINIKYLEYQRIQGKALPKNVEVSILNGEQLTRINLKYTRTDIPSNLTLPFEIPENYKRILL